MKYLSTNGQFLTVLELIVRLYVEFCKQASPKLSNVQLVLSLDPDCLAVPQI
jgi:hypothetical protein